MVIYLSRTCIDRRTCNSTVASTTSQYSHKLIVKIDPILSSAARKCASDVVRSILGEQTFAVASQMLTFNVRTIYDKMIALSIREAQPFAFLKI